MTKDVITPREELAIAENVVYLNNAAIGPLPLKSHLKIQEMFINQARFGESKLDLDHMIQIWDSVRDNFAKLINGFPSGVSITTNTASGLHIVADGLSSQFSAGNNIVISELEFTTNSYLWQQLAKRHKLELRVAKFDGDKLRWDYLINNQTKLVSVSFVQFGNGYRENIKRLTDITHDKGGEIVVDAIQGLGVVPFDVLELDVDYIASGGYKWLLGPLGSGFFYCNPNHLEKLDSILVGWFSDRDFLNMTHHTFEPWEDARKFQQSLFPTMEALNCSLDTIIRWDPKKTFEHVLNLINYFIESIPINSKFRIASPLSPNSRSGILKLDHPDAEKIVDKLKESNIITAYRDGGIRISPHRYNSIEEMSILATHLFTDNM